MERASGIRIGFSLTFRTFFLQAVLPEEFVGAKSDKLLVHNLRRRRCAGKAELYFGTGESAARFLEPVSKTQKQI